MAEALSEATPDTGESVSKKEEEDAPPLASLKELFYYADQWSMIAFFIGFLGCACAGAIYPAFNFLFGNVIDASAGTGGDVAAALAPTVHNMLALAGIGFATNLVAFYFTGWAASRVANGFRIEYLRAVLRQDATIFDHAEPGELALTLSDAALDIQTGFSDKFAQMLIGIFQLFFGFAFAFYFQWLFTLVLLAFVPILGIVSYALFQYGSMDGITGRKAYESAASIASETFSNVRTVMALNAETKRSEQYDSQLSTAQQAAIKQGIFQAALLGGLFMVMFIMYGFGFWFGGLLIANSTDDAMEKYPRPDNMLDESSPWYGIIVEACAPYLTDIEALEVCACSFPWDEVPNIPNPNCGCGYLDETLDPGQTVCLSGGTALNVFFCVLIGGFAFGQIGPGLKALQQARLSAAKMLQMIRRYPVIDVTKTAENSNQRALKREDVNGEIVFDNVAFHYTPKEDNVKPPPVFSKINFTVKPGETVALVGESGCGKSTISKLVQRFYDPTQGEIRLDGVSLKEFALKDLRACIGVVSQEPLLFDTSILENIRTGQPDATDEDVVEAAKNANAHDFISTFPEGYHTKVGSKGGKLSGGQKQRVAIARALLRDPPILILDEATSALDNKSEKTVQKTLNELEKKFKRTTIVIAHRMSTIRNADHICVLGSPEGTSTAATGSSVLEEGNHKELMKINGGLYKALVMAGSGSSTIKESFSSLRSSTESVLVSGSLTDDKLASLSSSNASALDDVAENDGTDVSTTFTNLGKSIVSSESEKGDENKGFWGKMFAPKDPEEIEKKKEEEEYFKKGKNRIWKYTKPDLKWIIFGSVASALKGVVMPAVAIIFSSMFVAYFQFDTDDIRADSLKWSYFFYGLAIALFVLELIQKGVFEMIGERLCRKIRSDLFRAILRQDITWFEDEKNALGFLSSKLSTDVKYVRLVTGQPIAATLETVSTLLAGMIIALVSSWEILLVMLAMIPFLGITQVLNWMAISGSESKIKESVESCSATLNETINGIREVQTFALQDKVLNDVETEIRTTVLPKSVNVAISQGVVLGMVQLITFGIYALAFWFGGEMINMGRINFEEFFRALMAMMFAGSGLGPAALFFGDTAKANAAVNSISVIFDHKADIDSKPWEDDGLAEVDTGLPITREVSKEAVERGEFDLKEVNFSYPTRKAAKVFNQISLTIPQGKTMALVGSSGCGKSTIVQLLERFYDPISFDLSAGENGDTAKPDNIYANVSKEGDIEIGVDDMEVENNGQVQLDGVDMRTLDLRWVRKNMGLVGQEPVLFNDTVYNNIALGKDGCTKEDVEAAAKSANAYDFIMELPDKFDTNVGMMGSKVSGGQKQRIAIARALVAKPKILLLDEATSALDNESEKIVQDGLNKLLEESRGLQTTVIIAHRLSTIRNADVICVLDNDGDGSKVVERGTHDELMALGKKYKALVEAYSK
eukprot:CAMPEP_0178930166 /NCGR_PEP_ID=MMETSP0786-20121207/21060_1 /TAXON_ID=186022 /ORGANISM="Thalassionema frauenfeldii, Strain CCMP 1798" /LENGTH=1444 /DNA_ID=CAMNT_0020606615 /DNA_START=119 /DNA_END=4453 /DNA_ORIENTATION=+